MTDYLNLTLGEEALRNMSSLGLAHLGDAVYELMVRSFLCAHGKATSKGLHRAAVKYVSASAQATAADKLLPHLSEVELSVYRRGRNTRVNSVPQNSTREAYHQATALEALFGYLYLCGETKRLNELFSLVMEM